VEADEVMGIAEFKLCEACQELRDEGGMARVEAVLGGFELGQERIGIVRRG